MTITHILRLDAVGETLAVAYCETRPVAIHADLWDEPERLRLGASLTGRLRHVTPDGRGAFLETPTGETVYMDAAPARTPLGTALPVRVAAEARSGKQARVTPLASAPGASPPPPADPFTLWRETLPGGAAARLDTAPDPGALHACLDDALSPTVPLPAGGRLTLSRTPALTAVDVDTAGRRDKGRAGARAQAVNLDAARTLGQQLALRGLGGLVVLDCIAPLIPAARTALKPALIAAFREGSQRRIAALAPSPFGLLEASLAWGPRPIDEAFLDAAGHPLPRTCLLEGLRRLDAEARSQPGAHLVLSLPESAYACYRSRQTRYLDALTARHGARIDIRRHDRQTVEISHASGPALPDL